MSEATGASCSKKNPSPLQSRSVRMSASNVRSDGVGWQIAAVVPKVI
jgi:hypothetical protein